MHNTRGSSSSIKGAFVRSIWWREITELDDEQQAVVELSIDTPRVIITGEPGTGKTNLALLRARYLILADCPNTVVLTIGRVVKEFILHGASLHGLSSENIQTFHQLGRRLIRDAGESFYASSSYEETTESLVSQLNNLSLNNKLSKFDAIIIDEAQDFPPESVPLFPRISDRLFIVGDQNQRIMSGTKTTIDLFREGSEKITLKNHYRNGLKICRFAGALKNIDLAVNSRYDELANPSSFERIVLPSLREQILRIAQRIPSQLAAYPDEFIGILAPRASDLEEIIQLIDDETDLADLVQLQSNKSGYSSINLERPIIALTFNSAKGLEFRSAHIVNLDAFAQRAFTSETRNLIFTAATRAKTSLTIYHSNPLPSWLESAVLKTIDATRVMPNLSQLFPKITC